MSSRTAIDRLAAVPSKAMAPASDEPRPLLLGGIAALGLGGVAAVASLIALDVDAAAAFWAMTAGLPLVTFVVLMVVVLARRMGGADDGPGPS